MGARSQATEESPGTVEQDAGRKPSWRNPKESATEKIPQMKRCKGEMARQELTKTMATWLFMQTPSGARPNRGRSRAARPSSRVGR